MLNEPLRVLIVHGGPQHAEDVTPILEDAGLATRVVTDSVSALGVLEVWQPQAVVVDLRFPSSAARQFCQDLSARKEMGHPPLVLVGAGHNLLKRQAVTAAGLVPTPIDADCLMAAVKRVAQPSAAHAGFEAPLSR